MIRCTLAVVATQILGALSEESSLWAQIFEACSSHCSRSADIWGVLPSLTEIRNLCPFSVCPLSICTWPRKSPKATGDIDLSLPVRERSCAVSPRKSRVTAGLFWHVGYLLLESFDLWCCRRLFCACAVYFMILLANINFMCQGFYRRAISKQGRCPLVRPCGSKNVVAVAFWRKRSRTSRGSCW